MNKSAFWANLQRDFRRLRKSDSTTEPVQVFELDFHRGPSRATDRAALHGQLRALAARAGAMLDPRGNDHVATWINALRDDGNRVSAFEWVRTENGPVTPCDLRFDAIDAPDSTAGVHEVDAGYPEILVEPAPNGRYALIAGHAVYALRAREGVDTVRCLLREPSTQKEVHDSLALIEHFIDASIELCEKLNTDAFIRERASASSSERGVAGALADAAVVGPATSDSTRYQTMGREPAQESSATPSSDAPFEDPKKLWSVSEIVKTFDLHPDTVRRRIKKEGWHTVRLGPRSTRVLGAEINRLIEENRLRYRS